MFTDFKELELYLVKLVKRNLLTLAQYIMVDWSEHERSVLLVLFLFVSYRVACQWHTNSVSKSAQQSHPAQFNTIIDVMFLRGISKTEGNCESIHRSNSLQNVTSILRHGWNAIDDRSECFTPSFLTYDLTW